MGALKVKEWDSITHSLDLLEEKTLARHRASFDFTNANLADVFVKEEDKKFVYDAYIALHCTIISFNVNISNSNVTFSHSNVTFSQNSSLRFAMPRYIGSYVNPHSKDLPRLEQWVTKARHIQNEFYLAKKFIEHLDSRCANVHTLRFVFPPLLGLATHAGLPLTDKIRDLKVPRYVPRLHTCVPAMVERFQALITKAMIVSNTLHAENQVSISINGPSARIPLPWNQFEPVSED